MEMKESFTWERVVSVFHHSPWGGEGGLFSPRKSLEERDLWPLDFEDTEEGYLTWVGHERHQRRGLSIITSSPKGQVQGVY